MRLICITFGTVFLIASTVAGESVTAYVTSAGNARRLAAVEVPQPTRLTQPEEGDPCVFIDAGKTFQTVLGIGGAITDAAAETFGKLPPDRQAELIDVYFDPDHGLGYSLIRTHINSCDFSSASYSYVSDNDSGLGSFSIEREVEARIPLVKRALARAKGRAVVYVSPWSPPAWMKDTGRMVQGGKLLPEHRKTWANYIVKTIAAYEASGVPIWGLTVQNEPMATQTWESCVFTAEEERDFVRDHLGPTLHAAGMQDKKLMIWDHNRNMIYHRASTVLNDPEAAKYVWGVGYHWYMSDSYENISLVKQAYPDAHLIFTEGCVYPFDAAKLGEWHWGERYGKAMIQDFNAGAEGWTDWNILLDMQGGPNHVGNYCFAPVHADVATGQLHYMSSFYYIGHFSKYVRPGAKRIVSSSMLDDLLTTAFQNPDGSIVAVVMNETDKPISYKLVNHGQARPLISEAHSIMTVVFNP